MEVMHYLQLLGGLVLLLAGAEGLVRGSSRLAAYFGLSPLVIGLTVVALGTSSPEIAVSVAAAASGKGDVALGNVIGSNMANILLILGVSAIIIPLAVVKRLVRIDLPILIGATVIVMLMSIDGHLGRIDGALLTAALIGYIAFQFKAFKFNRPHAGQSDATQRRKEQHTQEESGRNFHLALNILLVGAGLTIMVFGSRWLVEGASAAARTLGLSELIIGITIIAIGTSLPEVATSVLAALKGEREIAVGNIVGSNVFNTLGVLGLGSLAATGLGIEIHQNVLHFDFPIMLAITVACVPIFFSRYQISRSEGAMFIGYYAAYLLHIFLKATNHAATSTFELVMLWGVIPLTVLTLVFVTWRNYGSSRQTSVSTKNGTPKT